MRRMQPAPRAGCLRGMQPARGAKWPPEAEAPAYNAPSARPAQTAAGTWSPRGEEPGTEPDTYAPSADPAQTVGKPQYVHSSAGTGAHKPDAASGAGATGQGDSPIDAFASGPRLARVLVNGAVQHGHVPPGWTPGGS